MENPEILSTTRFAKRFNVSRALVHAAIVKGDIPAFRIGTAYRVKLAEIPPNILDRLTKARVPKPVMPVGNKVYFIGAANGPVKIGISRDPLTRLARLNTSAPVALSLLCWTMGGADLEAEYHDRFKRHRLNGEWFHPHPDILAEIRRIEIARAASERHSE